MPLFFLFLFFFIKSYLCLFSQPTCTSLLPYQFLWLQLTFVVPYMWLFLPPACAQFCTLPMHCFVLYLGIITHLLHACLSFYPTCVYFVSYLCLFLYRNCASFCTLPVHCFVHDLCIVWYPTCDSIVFCFVLILPVPSFVSYLCLFLHPICVTLNRLAVHFFCTLPLLMFTPLLCILYTTCASFYSLPPTCALLCTLHVHCIVLCVCILYPTNTLFWNLPMHCFTSYLCIFSVASGSLHAVLLMLSRVPAAWTKWNSPSSACVQQPQLPCSLLPMAQTPAAKKII